MISGEATKTAHSLMYEYLAPSRRVTGTPPPANATRRTKEKKESIWSTDQRSGAWILFAPSFLHRRRNGANSQCGLAFLTSKVHDFWRNCWTVNSWVCSSQGHHSWMQQWEAQFAVNPVECLDVGLVIFLCQHWCDSLVDPPSIITYPQPLFCYPLSPFNTSNTILFLYHFAYTVSHAQLYFTYYRKKKITYPYVQFALTHLLNLQFR